MKKLILLVTAVIVTVGMAWAQPQKFNYQGVARSSTGSPLASQNIGLRISILDGSSSGTSLYTEAHNVTTNSMGLYSVAVGGGSVVSGNFATIDWAAGDRYVKVELDPAGGTSYVNLGATQLLSVPYALYSANGGTTTINGTAGYVPVYTSSATMGNSNMVATSSGVGINITTPVNGALHIHEGSGSYGGLHLTNSATDSLDSDGFLYGGTDINSLDATVWNFENGNLIFGTNFTERARITPEGNVGIGNTTPAATLQITGNNPAGATFNTVTFENNGLLVNNGLVTSSGTMRGVVSAVDGGSSECHGVFGMGFSATGYNVGVFGLAEPPSGNISPQYGVYGNAIANSGGTSYGVYGRNSGSGYAGYFDGDVSVIGTLSKSGGTFKIDHPLDPANKYLSHSFVESPDMMNLYNGNITTDGSGYATVTLPDYFDALNKDFRYQLTVIGTFAQAIVAEKIHNNQFVIRTNQPNVEVSWQVSGVRKDKWADAHRVQVETNKEPENKGYYLNAKEFDMPVTKSIGYHSMPKSEQELVGKTGK